MQHYTPAQTRWFLAAVSRRERDRRTAAVMDARMAEAEVGALREYLAELRRV